MEDTLIQITNYLLTQSWQVAVLVVVVAILNLALRNKSAHVRYLLWLIVLAKCLVPPSFTIPLAILPQEGVTESVPTSRDQMPSVALEATDEIATEPPAPFPSPITGQPAATIEKASAKLTVRHWLGLGWIAGVACFVIAAVTKALRIEFWLRRRRKPLGAGARSEIEKSFSGLKMRVLPNMWLAEGIGQPFVWGLLRGDIYLPADFAGVNSVEYRRDVLGHELSHVLRYDAAVNFLQIITQALFWFHPLVWWANKRIRVEREKCCDEMTISRLNTQAKDYSKAIVNALVTEYESIRPIPSLAVAGSTKNIEERIRTILKPGKRFYKRPSMVAMTVVLLLALLTVPTVLVLTARAQTEMKGTVEERVTENKVTCSGKVVDAEGRPIAGAKVTAYEMIFDGLAGNFKLFQEAEMTTAEDGAFTFTSGQKPERSRFHQCYIVAAKHGLALGWVSWKMREDAEKNIELGKPTRLEGVIVDEAGAPVAGAEVRANFYQTMETVDGERKTEWMPGIAPLNELGTFTDRQGRFSFGNVPEDFGVDLLVTKEGKAVTYTQTPDRKPAFKTGQTDIKVVLPAEARIEGELVYERTGKGVARTRFAVVAEFSNLFYYRFVCSTDDEGRFSVGGLRSGRYLIRNGGFPHTEVDVKSGKTTKLTVQRTYRSYYFHVLLDRGSPEVVKPKQKITVHFEENSGVREAGCIDIDGYLKAYITDKEYRQWQLGKGWFAALVPEDGGKSFRREEVFSYYDLTRNWPKNITTKKAESQEESSLLMGKPLPGIKDLGAVLPSTEISGKMMLICFFDIAQRPSRNLLQRLRARAQELKSKGLLIVAVHVSKVDTGFDEWLLGSHGIPFPMGTFQGDEEKARSTWGVQALPWLILTDRKHVVIAEGFDLDELDEKVEAVDQK